VLRPDGIALDRVRTLGRVSQTERALEADDTAGDTLGDAPADDTGEFLAELDEALEEYVASVEEYAGTDHDDPFAAPPDLPANGHPNGTNGRDHTGGTAVDTPVDDVEGEVDDSAFFVLPEIIAPDDEVTVADLADPDAKVPPATAPESDVLEDLKRSDIDGPIVEVKPHDDLEALGRRRPKRVAEYDPAPIPIPAKPPRLLGRKPRVRKVTRVVRHVDPWSVFKIAIVANLVLYVIVMTAGVLLWNVANATGTVDNVERFFESFGWESFEFNGGEIYHAAWIAGLFVALGLTGLAVLLATLFNLITDLVGGVRMTVLEEEVVEKRTSPMRRFVVRRPEPEVPAKLEDSTGPIIREAVVDDTGGFERPG